MPKDLTSQLRQSLHQARALLEGLQQIGLNEVAKPAAGEGVDFADLEAVRQELGDCRRCSLADNRTQIVYGVGDPCADLVFVGEGPGREEDLQGEPFVGEAGRLLDRILAAMSLSRSQVYICNVVKCRPPGNRDPEPGEIAACEPFLLRQLQAIQPRVIVALGKFAAQTLLKQQTPISRLRGHWTSYQGIPLMPTFHPAYLLRNPQSKREVWEDMKQVIARLRQGEGGR